MADDELGLSGDRGALALVVVWAELLIVTIVAASFLYRRWARGPTYLLTTPVIVALLFLLFENFDRLLPATLCARRLNARPPAGVGSWLCCWWRPGLPPR